MDRNFLTRRSNATSSGKQLRCMLTNFLKLLTSHRLFPHLLFSIQAFIERCILTCKNIFSSGAMGDSHPHLPEAVQRLDEQTLINLRTDRYHITLILDTPYIRIEDRLFPNEPSFAYARFAPEHGTVVFIDSGYGSQQQVCREASLNRQRRSIIEVLRDLVKRAGLRCSMYDAKALVTTPHLPHVGRLVRALQVGAIQNTDVPPGGLMSFHAENVIVGSDMKIIIDRKLATRTTFRPIASCNTTQRLRLRVPRGTTRTAHKIQEYPPFCIIRVECPQYCGLVVLDVEAFTIFVGDFLQPTSRSRGIIFGDQDCLLRYLSTCRLLQQKVVELHRYGESDANKPTVQIHGGHPKVTEDDQQSALCKNAFYVLTSFIFFLRDIFKRQIAPLESRPFQYWKETQDQLL